jgi:RNA polymerase sigma-70 factor (sigma-E family)
MRQTASHEIDSFTRNLAPSSWNRVGTLGAYNHVTARPTESPVQPPASEWTFEEVYRSHYPRLVVLARLMTGALVYAEEIVQDAFVQLYRNWSAVEYPLTYVRIAVVNGCRSHGRRRAVERRHPVPDQEPVVLDTAAVAVRDALQALTARQRAAVVLRFYEDLSERRVAELLGCLPGTVKSLVSRGLETLRNEIRGEESE